jgi:hypothetical protein
MREYDKRRKGERSPTELQHCNPLSSGFSDFGPVAAHETQCIINFVRPENSIEWPVLRGGRFEEGLCFTVGKPVPPDDRKVSVVVDCPLNPLHMIMVLPGT